MGIKANLFLMPLQLFSRSKMAGHAGQQRPGVGRSRLTANRRWQSRRRQQRRGPSKPPHVTPFSVVAGRTSQRVMHSQFVLYTCSWLFASCCRSCRRFVFVQQQAQVDQYAFTWSAVSPSRQKRLRNLRNAASSVSSVKSKLFAYSSPTIVLKSFFLDRCLATSEPSAPSASRNGNRRRSVSTEASLRGWSSSILSSSSTSPTSMPGVGAIDDQFGLMPLRWITGDKLLLPLVPRPPLTAALVNGGLGTSGSNNLSPVIQRKGINPNWSSIAPTPGIEVGEVDDDDNIDDDQPRNEASVETDRLRLPLRDAEGAEGSCQEDGGLRSPPDGGSDTESLPESIYHQPPKAADREAAARLARRLYLLEGFKFTDVAKHLSRKNDFNTIVGEEYANNFDFTDDTLDAALRKFLSRFCLLGDTADQERVLLHFAKSYLRCNPASYPSADSCHTLACALLLLNKDLHGMTGQRMTSQQFIDNLANLNEGDNYPREVLKSLYQAIRAQPILQPASGPIVPQHLLMQQPAGNGGGGDELRVHHSLASPAGDYAKRRHVWRLRLANGAEYLLQCQSAEELDEWVVAVNRAAALLSSPALPPPVGSQPASAYARPLLPSVPSHFGPAEQLERHQEQVLQIERELQFLSGDAAGSSSPANKDNNNVSGSAAAAAASGDSSSSPAATPSPANLRRQNSTGSSGSGASGSLSGGPI
uniref:SEC7 domain-containing protein n=1 Tax=Macrostomum lignano TaxID=282301 RepID=A0A1I8JCX3_9PLAT